MSFIAPLIGLAGTATSAIGDIQSGNAANDAAKQNAANAVEDASIREQEQRLQDQRTIASGKAGIGSSGVTYSGSALDVMAESARNAELNALVIRRGGQLTANSQLKAGANAQRAGYTNAAGTLLTGGVGVGKQLSILGNNKPVPPQFDLTPTS